MSDTASYLTDPEAAIRQRRLAMAQALSKMANEGTPIRAHSQGLARMAQGALAGFLAGREERLTREQGESNRAGAAGWNPLAAAVNGQGASPPAPMSERLGGAPPAEGPAPVPQVQRQPLVAALNGTPPPNMYGRNADAAPARDALLDAPPQMLAAASAARSSAPQIPGGYREPGPQSEGGPWAADLPPATGVIPGAGMGGPQPPAPQPQASPQPAPAPQQQQAPQGLDLNMVAQRIAAGLNDPNPLIRRQAQAYAQMLPALRAQSDRAEDRTTRAGERTQDRDWRTQDIAAQRAFAAEQEQRQRAFAAEQAAQARAFQEQQQGRQLQQPPAGYRPTQDGGFQAVPGGPADPAQAQALARARGEGTLPPQQITGAMLENVAAVRKIDQALDALKERGGQGVGIVAGLTPDAILNRTDPQGTGLRALIADIGSLKIHDRSGAAVSASEFPRLRPFIPAVSDSPATLRDKLSNFRREYDAMLRDQYSVYGPQGGGRTLAPVEALLNPQQAPQSGGAAPGAAPRAPAPGTVQDGYAFRGGDPANPASWERAQ